MSKVSFKKSLTKDATSPFSIETLDKRLKNNKTIDLRRNYRILNLDSNYVGIEPVDKNKLWK